MLVCLLSCLTKKGNSRQRTKTPTARTVKIPTPPQHSPACAPELSEDWEYRVAGRLGHLATAARIGPWRGCEKPGSLDKAQNSRNLRQIRQMPLKKHTQPWRPSATRTRLPSLPTVLSSAASSLNGQHSSSEVALSSANVLAV